MSIKFNIVEGNSTKEFFNTYNSIVKDLKNGLSVNEIKEKYGLLSGSWRKFQKQLVKDGFLQNRQMKQAVSKYYYEREDGFIVSKYNNTGSKYIAQFKDEKDAIRCVELMKECGWDLSKRDEIVEKVKQGE